MLSFATDRSANAKPSRRLPSHFLPTETLLLNLPELVPANFRYGVKILNGNATPMQFVVGALEKHLGLSRSASIRAMLDIHTKGGALLPTASPEEAYRVAAAISADSAALGHTLVCRPAIAPPWGDDAHGA